MAEAKTTLRMTEPVAPAGDPSALESPPLPPTPELPAPTKLKAVVAEMQSRLATGEKRRASAARTKRPAEPAEDSAPGSPGSPGSPTPSAPALLDERLREFREMEAALLAERMALHTRTQAAAKQESELAKQAADLRLEEQKIVQEQQAMAEAWAELDARGKQLEEQRTAPIGLDEAKATAHPIAGARPDPGGMRVAMTVSLSVLALAALAGLSIALAWLTVMPVYQAAATVAPAPTPIESTAPADHFSEPMLEGSLDLLRQRGMRPYDSPAAMAADLSARLTVAAGLNRELLLTYEAPRREEAVLVLEALTRSYAKAYADRGARITHAAAADLFPFRDDRPRRAATWFAAFVGIALLSAIGLRWVARRSGATG